MFTAWRYQETGFGLGMSEVKKTKSYRGKKTIGDAFNRAAGLSHEDLYMSLAEWGELTAPSTKKV